MASQGEGLLPPLSASWPPGLPTTLANTEVCGAVGGGWGPKSNSNTVMARPISNVQVASASAHRRGRGQDYRWPAGTPLARY